MAFAASPPANLPGRKQQHNQEPQGAWSCAPPTSQLPAPSQPHTSSSVRHLENALRFQQGSHITDPLRLLSSALLLLPQHLRASPRRPVSPNELDCKLSETTNMVPNTFLLLTPSTASLRGRQCPLNGQAEGSPSWAYHPSLQWFSKRWPHTGKAACLTWEPLSCQQGAVSKKALKSHVDCTVPWLHCHSFKSDLGLLGNSYTNS